MFRRLLALYLLLVTAAGPNLCCCSLTHLVAAGPERASCCNDADSLPPCCRKATDQGPPVTSEQTPSKPSRGAPAECPCHKQGTKPVTVAKNELGLQDRAHFGPDFLLLSLDRVDNVFQHSSPILNLSLRSSALFLSAEDLLYAHHQLRC
jgi:hypothetical protein